MGRPVKAFPGYTADDLRQQGIYGIVCNPTGCIYIGQTYSYFSSRWSTHLSALKHGRHGSRALQEDWDKYGADAFTFCILDCAPMTINADWMYAEWRGYLEGRRIAEYPLVYNTVKPVGRTPGGNNPYRSLTSI